MPYSCRAVITGCAIVCLFATSWVAIARDAERPGRLAEQLEIAVEQLATKPMVAGAVLAEVAQITQLYNKLDGQPAWVNGCLLYTSPSPRD